MLVAEVAAMLGPDVDGSHPRDLFFDFAGDWSAEISSGKGEGDLEGRGRSKRKLLSTVRFALEELEVAKSASEVGEVLALSDG